VVSAAEARIVGVPAGAAKIQITKPGGVDRSFELEIASDRTIELEAAASPPSVWPTALVISGAIAAAVGAGTIIAGAALAGGDVSLCVVRDRPSECDGGGPKFEDGPGGLAQPTGADASPPWALIVGTGFATLGVTLAAGAFAFADFEDAHWWVIAGSVALGLAGSGIAYAVSAN
jgi:hypothetical protein